MPAPMMAMRAVVFKGAAGRVLNQAARMFVVSEGCFRLPASMSRLRPKPGRFCGAKPADVSARRTAPATVNVPNVAPGADSRATSLKISGDHIAGLRSGAKPSKNHASI